eukprot:6207663-Pleurochrysis_carterae.AAC.4
MHRVHPTARLRARHGKGEGDEIDVADVVAGGVARLSAWDAQARGLAGRGRDGRRSAAETGFWSRLAGLCACSSRGGEEGASAGWRVGNSGEGYQPCIERSLLLQLAKCSREKRRVLSHRGTTDTSIAQDDAVPQHAAATNGHQHCPYEAYVSMVIKGREQSLQRALAQHKRCAHKQDVLARRAAGNQSQRMRVADGHLTRRREIELGELGVLLSDSSAWDLCYRCVAHRDAVMFPGSTLQWHAHQLETTDELAALHPSTLCDK